MVAKKYAKTPSSENTLIFPVHSIAPTFVLFEDNFYSQFWRENGGKKMRKNTEFENCANLYPAFTLCCLKIAHNVLEPDREHEPAPLHPAGDGKVVEVR